MKPMISDTILRDAVVTHEQEGLDRIADLGERDRGERGEIFLVARFRAPDYARLKRAFDGLQPLRERHGARGHSASATAREATAFSGWPMIRRTTW